MGKRGEVVVSCMNIQKTGNGAADYCPRKKRVVLQLQLACGKDGTTRVSAAKEKRTVWRQLAVSVELFSSNDAKCR